MSTVTFACQHCGSDTTKTTSAYNRAMRLGRGVYCDRRCAGMARRTGTDRTSAEWRASKAAYDRERRARLGEALREKKRQAYWANHEDNLRRQREARAARMADPEALRAYREAQRRCYMRPKYREQKRQSDRRYRAERDYGGWADAHVALMDLMDAVREREPEHHRRAIAKGNVNKKTNRQRAARRAHVEQPDR